MGRSVGGGDGGRLLTCGLFLCFSISDCKERILVAGWCTDLVRGTKTGKEEGGDHVSIKTSKVCANKTGRQKDRLAFSI